MPQLRSGATYRLKGHPNHPVRILGRFNSADDIYRCNHTGEAFIGVTTMQDGTEWTAEYLPDGTRLWDCEPPFHRENWDLIDAPLD